MIVVHHSYHDSAKKRLDSVIKLLDSHISVLEAKLLYIIHSYDPNKDLIFNYEKRLEVVRKEIEFADSQKRRLLKLYAIEDEQTIHDMINDIMKW